MPTPAPTPAQAADSTPSASQKPMHHTFVLQREPNGRFGFSFKWLVSGQLHVSLLSNPPAKGSGLAVGDVITKLGDTETAGASRQDILSTLQKSLKLTLVVLRPSGGAVAKAPAPAPAPTAAPSTSQPVAPTPTVTSAAVPPTIASAPVPSPAPPTQPQTTAAGTSIVPQAQAQPQPQALARAPAPQPLMQAQAPMLQATLPGAMHTIVRPSVPPQASTLSITLQKSPSAKYGMRLRMVDHKVVVTGVLGEPASSSDLRAHDVVVAVNGRPLRGLNFQQVLALLRVNVVTLSVVRAAAVQTRQAVPTQPQTSNSMVQPSWVIVPTQVRHLLRQGQAHNQFRGVFHLHCGQPTTWFTVSFMHHGVPYHTLEMGVFASAMDAAQYYDACMLTMKGTGAANLCNFITSPQAAAIALQRLRAGKPLLGDGFTGKAQQELVPGHLWVAASISKADTGRVRNMIIALSYLNQGTIPPGQFLPGYSAPRGGQKNSAWMRSVPRQPTQQPPKFVRNRRRRRKRPDWADTETEETDSDMDETFRGRASKTQTAPRRSLRNRGQTKKTYRFDYDTDELEGEDATIARKTDSDTEDDGMKVDKVLGVRFTEAACDAGFTRDMESVEFLVKWKHLSYLHTEWVAPVLIKKLAKKQAERFLASLAARRQLDTDKETELAHLAEVKKVKAKGGDPDSVTREYRDNTSYFPAELVTADRILDMKMETYTPEGEGGHPQPPQQAPMYLIKWLNQSHLEATWEWAKDINDEDQIARFMRFSRPPRIQTLHPAAFKDVRPPVSNWAKYAQSPMYNGGRELRDYQLEGLNWLVFNWYQRRNCLLADEMGLGKTIQTLSFYHHLFTREHVRGPFLVVAPLSTLLNWQREFETWTDLNVVVYHDTGGASARSLLREREFRYSAANSTVAQRRLYKFHVLLTTYTILKTDWEHLSAIHWRAVTIDEAHNLRNQHSQLLQCVNALSFDTILLLTGTPIHNNIQELWTLLNVMDRHRYPSLQQFVDQYGGLQGSEQIAKLQSDLRPLLLRRVKEDVETTIPAKEETIIHVELTNLQKKYYRAIFERNRVFLSHGGSSVANLVNVQMELRKCCNHPFLIRGLMDRELATTTMPVDELMIQCSGKLALLDKLLPKLRSEGHKVLIFSQFKIMLDVLADFCEYRQYKFERIDGSVSSRLRQPAIDRFNDRSNPAFVFLLTTTAGGVGINLTAADTVVLYDSDWNPQNDLQAIARCHRIGQTEMVRVYRLITKKTYEAEMLRRAGRKLGLSQALLETGGMVPTFEGDEDDEIGDNLSQLANLDVQKIETLLKFGAYALLDEDDGAGEKFFENDIDTILTSSTTHIKYDVAKEKSNDQAGAVASADSKGDGQSDGKTSEKAAPVSFATATFAAVGADTKLDVKDPAFWEKVLGPKAVDKLWKMVKEGTFNKISDEEMLSFIRDVEGLIVEVLENLKKGVMHEDTETLTSLLIELQVRGSLKTLPPEAAERMPMSRPTVKHLAEMWSKAMNAKRRRRNSKTAYPNLLNLHIPLPKKGRKRRAPRRTSDEPTSRRNPKGRARARASRAKPKKTKRAPKDDEDFVLENDDDDDLSDVVVARPAKRTRRRPNATATATDKPAAGADLGAGAGDEAQQKRERAPSDEGKTGDDVSTKRARTKRYNSDNCFVCRQSEGFVDNPIVFCEGCNVAVHQYCYGIVEVPQGDDPWLCSACTHNVDDPVCALCSFTGGAFKPTNDGRWVHAVCALWSFACSFGDIHEMEPVQGVDVALESETGLCHLCSMTSVVVKCSKPGCEKQLHAICGRRQGLLMIMTSENTLQAFCDEHRRYGQKVEADSKRVLQARAAMG